MKAKDRVLPHDPGFRGVRQIYRRMVEEKEISIADGDVPEWQRQLVWRADDQGLLALSILQGYPIGLLVLWQKKDGVRVPIDGRQRLHAIERFMSGAVSIPVLDAVPPQLRGVKYKTLSDDDPDIPVLSARDRDDFDDYALTVVEYGPDTPMSVLADIFVRLQGGKPLTKTETRAALGGRVCDFVSKLTSAAFTIQPDDESAEPVDEPSTHPFFKLLKKNLPNTRKAHRNVCDVLLSEFLIPGSDKHWSSLDAMYREKKDSLKSSDEKGFREALTKFLTACSVDGKPRGPLMPQLRSAFLILTFFRAWQELSKNYAWPEDLHFGQAIGEFESLRVKHKDESPWVNFSAALSNAGYARNRSNERHDIFITWFLQKYPDLVSKDDTRLFTREQKLAIWHRAKRRCEWPEGCDKEFLDPKDADADHIFQWAKGGPTTVENGRLLWPAHNRKPRPLAKA